MTTEKLIQQAQQRGFLFIETMAGRIPVSEFDPYRINQDGKKDCLDWEWISWTQARDGKPDSLPGFACGVWQFYTTESDPW